MHAISVMQQQILPFYFKILMNYNSKSVKICQRNKIEDHNYYVLTTAISYTTTQGREANIIFDIPIR